LEIEEGGVDRDTTLTVLDVHSVVLQSPSALTKYVVLADGLTVIV
jgi:hypothetical protein